MLQHMDPDYKHVKISGNIERYAQCPFQLGHWCLTDYVSKLDITTKKL